MVHLLYIFISNPPKKFFMVSIISNPVHKKEIASLREMGVDS